MLHGRLALERIEAARRAIDGVFVATPHYRCEALLAALPIAARQAPAHVALKVECLNPVRSFKGRGAEAFVEVHGGSPLVCASAGNFGQAMAYACRRRGTALTVFAADAANELKVERMRALGAAVRLEGHDFDAAKDAARAFAERGGGRFVEDGREAEVAEGAGTIALELLEGGDRPEVLLVPLGNGALAAGVSAVVRRLAPATEIVLVAAAGADAMARSIREGRLVTGGRVSTIADGIAVRVPVPEALDDLRDVAADVVLVDDERIVVAMRLLHEHAGIVAEPAAAVGVAALLHDPARYADRRVTTIVTGGNLSARQMRELLLTEARPLRP